MAQLKSFIKYLQFCVNNTRYMNSSLTRWFVDILALNVEQLHILTFDASIKS